MKSFTLLTCCAALLLPDLAAAQMSDKRAPAADRPDRPGGPGGPDRPGGPGRPERPGGANRPGRPEIQPPRPGGPQIQPPRPGRPDARPPRPRPPQIVRPPRPPFQYPSGYRYRRWQPGLILPAIFLGGTYFVANYGVYGVYPPPRNYRWVRYGPDLLLVDNRTGRIKDVRYGVFG